MSPSQETGAGTPRAHLAAAPARRVLFSLDEVRRAGGRLMGLELGADGAPARASVAGVVRAPPAVVADVIEDVGGYAENVPMLACVRRNGDRVTVTLKFGISIFSVRFEFAADAIHDDARKWLELRWVSGEPRDLYIRFDLSDADDGHTLLQTTIGFDVMSLGWLVKVFLRHHPEIRFGVVPGAALTLSDGLGRVAEAKAR